MSKPILQRNGFFGGTKLSAHEASLLQEWIDLMDSANALQEESIEAMKVTIQSYKTIIGTLLQFVPEDLSELVVAIRSALED